MLILLKCFLYVSLESAQKNLSRMNHMLTMISWNLFYPRLHEGLNILWKNIENELRVYLSQRVAFQLPMLDFLWCCTFLRYKYILKFHVPSDDFFLQSFANFHVKVLNKDRNLRAFFSRVQNALSSNIFNHNTAVVL